jgi:hypothetical protein
VQAIRRGEITSPGGEQFHKVVYVGHSYSTPVGWNLATDYGEGLDAAVFTGSAHVATVTGALLFSSFYPAALDPKFAGDGLDPGYLTTLPGTRDEFLYKPAQFDPAVVEFDEKTKSTATATELATLLLSLNRSLDVRVPTLLVTGELDSQVCKENFDAVPPATGGGAGAVGNLLTPFEDTTLEPSKDVPGFQLGGTDCSSPEALIKDEGPHLGPHVPSMDAFVLPVAPHDVNQALNAQEYFTAVNAWIAATLGS